MCYESKFRSWPFFNASTQDQSCQLRAGKTEQKRESSWRTDRLLHVEVHACIVLDSICYLWRMPLTQYFFSPIPLRLLAIELLPSEWWLRTVWSMIESSRTREKACLMCSWRSSRELIRTLLVSDYHLHDEHICLSLQALEPRNIKPIIIAHSLGGFFLWSISKEHSKSIARSYRICCGVLLRSVRSSRWLRATLALGWIFSCMEDCQSGSDEESFNYCESNI